MAEVVDMKYWRDSSMSNINEMMEEAAREAGMTIQEYMQNQISDSVCDAFCTNCGHIQFDCVEPDAEYYTCEECQNQTLSSSVMLMLQHI